MRTRRSQVSPSRCPRSIEEGSRALLVVPAALASGACSRSGEPGDQPPRGRPPTPPATAAASPSPAAPPPRRGVLRPNDLLDAPASYLGRDVDLLIVEPLSG